MAVEREGIQKDRVARSFLRGLKTYETEAVVQKRVNERLIERIEGLGRPRYDRILEIGSGTGMFSRLLNERFRPSVFFVNDLVPECFQIVLKKLDKNGPDQIYPLFGDIEHLELPAKLDLVASSSTFQWLDDLSRFYPKVRRALNNEALFAFSMFGGDTYYEIKELTGTGLDYPSFTQVLDQLSRDFQIIHAEVDRDQLHFDHPRDVLSHIRSTGVGGVGGFSWTPRRYERFIEEYIAGFSTEQGVMLSYVSYLVIGRKKGD
ncbi:MAG: methyltransferase domain-containing protein [Desulfofustis sp.]|jgi:malonyl-CoA O-methyltransferase